MIEQHFDEWYTNSWILKWVEHDENVVRDAFWNGYKICDKHWHELMKDRQWLEGCLEDLDQEDEWREQEALRRGEG